MRMIGYCVRCRRIKQVTVRPVDMARGVPSGICDACREDKR